MPPNHKYFDWQNLRLVLNIETPDPRLKGYFETEVVNADQPESNWLRQGFVSYQLSDQWIVRGDRFFLAAPYYTTPPYFALETAHFAREPWNYYGYGVQVEGNFSNG